MLSLSLSSTPRGALTRHTSRLQHVLPTRPHCSITATKHYQNNTYLQNHLRNHRPWALQRFSPSSRWRRSLLSSVSDQTFMEEKISDDGILSVNPKPSKGFSSMLIYLLEALVVKFMHDTSLPLSGNFAPLRDETSPVKDLPVHGFLPVSSTGPPLIIYFSWMKVSDCLFVYYQECLNGEFLRVGPNPKFDPVTGYLWHVLLFNLF